MSEHLGTVGFAFNSSAMNVISGLTSTLGAYLKHAFPRNYFKHTFIGHSSVSMDPGKNDLGSEDIHKRVPRMAIVPSFNIEVPEMGGAIRMEKLQRPIGRVLTESVTHANALYLYCEDERVVRYDLTRMRMSFEITMTVETPLQAANVAAILDNSIYPEQWFFINRTPVPVEIPPLLLGLLAKDMDIDLSRPEDVSELMAHLDAHSMARVDHRVNPANGRSTASFYWPGNTLARFERPSVTPNRVEQSVADTTVTVSAALEYSYPDYWICVVKNTKKSDLDRLLEEADEKGWREEGGAVIVTIPIRLHPEREIGDMTLRFWQGFQVEANRIVDRLPFGSLVDRDLLSFIRDNADDVDLLGEVLHHQALQQRL